MPSDRYGLSLTTTPPAAAVYVDAVDRLLAAREGALEGFDRALAADPGFALAHIGRSRSLLVAGRGPEGRAAAAALALAGPLAPPGGAPGEAPGAAARRPRGPAPTPVCRTLAACPRGGEG